MAGVLPAWGVSQLSTNIPLGSSIYSDLDKLDGLGYLDAMQTGTRPYTRMQVAGWLEGIRDKMTEANPPEYAKTILAGLEAEFHDELTALGGAEIPNRLRLAELTWTNADYDGPTLAQHQTRSTYQPLNINNDGYRLADDLNSILTFRLEGNVGEAMVFSATPHLSYSKSTDLSADLEAGYFKTHLRNFQIQLGKEAMWWGQGQWGSLALTNNSEPFTALKFSNLEPLRLPGWFQYLGPTNTTFFYSKLGDDRTDVKNPAFVGWRTDFTPASNFTFAAGINSFLGGEGHEFGWDDLWDFLTQKNADSPSQEKWNSIAGFDFRWRLPQFNGLQIYGEYYGEDQAGFLPSRHALLLGTYLPRLTADGRWDLQLETSRTSRYWYNHWLYKDGYVNEGDIIGDAMGHNAERYDLQLNHYLANGNRLAFHGAYVAMDRAAVYPQEVRLGWISYTAKLTSSCSLEATAGLADIDNLDYQAGRSDRNHLFSIKLNYDL